MSYNYQAERPRIFSEDGQATFLKIRDTAKHLLKQAGAAQAGKIMSGATGDTWMMMACVDRLVELGELVEVTNPVSSWGQHRVFVDPSERP